MRAKLGWPILIFLSFSPLILWYFSLQPFQVRFDSFFDSLLAIGQALGLVGVSMFSLNLILSTRLKFFEDFFGGINHLYIAHHILGGVAFIFLLLHPLFLAANRMGTSFRYSLLLFYPLRDLTVTLGMLGLLLMMFLLILTFFIKLHYNLWLFTHKFLGAAFFLGAVHGILVSSDISRTPFLEGYMLFFLGMGLIAFTYRTLLGKFLIKRITYEVTEIASVGKGVLKIAMVPVGKAMVFNPGQFLFIRFVQHGVSTEIHPFSISSLSTDNTLEITVKAEGDYTKKLSSLLPGAHALIEGAFGRFEYRTVTYLRQVWIAGGIGITPFMGMARSLLYHPEYQVDLYYSMHDETDAVYLSELESIAHKHSAFRVIPFYSTKQGRLSAESIQHMSGDLHHTDIFLCGPPAMMHTLKVQFRTLHIPTRFIHSEEFSW